MRGDQSRYRLGGIGMEKGRGVSLFMGQDDCPGRDLQCRTPKTDNFF